MVPSSKVWLPWFLKSWPGSKNFSIVQTWLPWYGHETLHDTTQWRVVRKAKCVAIKSIEWICDWSMHDVEQAPHRRVLLFFEIRPNTNLNGSYVLLLSVKLWLWKHLFLTVSKWCVAYISLKLVVFELNSIKTKKFNFASK